MTTKVERTVRYDDTELEGESLKKVKEELKETDENRKNCLEILKKKLTDKADLNSCLDDNFLLAFLRVSKFDCNKAYQRLVGYYTERWNYPEIFKDCSPNSIKLAETARQLFASPYRAADNSAIIILKRRDYDSSKVHHDLILNALRSVSEVTIQHPLNQMCGGTLIMDLKSSSWSGWSDYTPARMKLIARLSQKVLVWRIRAIHVINAPQIYYLLYSITYPFLSSKLKGRIFLHKNTESLHSCIDPENLPKEYDGCLEQSELINLFERTCNSEEFLLKQSKYGFIRKKK